MSIVRSGIPNVVEGVVGVASPLLTAAALRDTPTTWFSVENLDTVSGLRVYFNAFDWENDIRGVLLAPGAHRDFPVELYGNKGVYLRAVSGDPDATVAYQLIYAQRVV